MRMRPCDGHRCLFLASLLLFFCESCSRGKYWHIKIGPSLAIWTVLHGGVVRTLRISSAHQRLFMRTCGRIRHHGDQLRRKKELPGERGMSHPRPVYEAVFLLLYGMLARDWIYGITRMGFSFLGCYFGNAA